MYPWNILTFPKKSFSCSHIPSFINYDYSMSISLVCKKVFTSFSWQLFCWRCLKQIIKKINKCLSFRRNQKMLWVHVKGLLINENAFNNFFNRKCSPSEPNVFLMISNSTGRKLGTTKYYRTHMASWNFFKIFIKMEQFTPQTWPSRSNFIENFAKIPLVQFQ